MADTSNLSNFLSDVAEAIRAKKETIDTIPAKDFDTEILSIETGINTSDATATADNIENGYTAYVNGEKISGTITTSLDTIITTGSDATITDTGEALTVDRGYGEKIILKSEQQLRSTIPYATIASIGEITADKIIKGKTIFGIEGAAEAGEERVVIFDTLEEMEQDTITNNRTANLAGAVYSAGWKTVEGTRKVVNTVKFPDTVVLDTPVTSTISGTFLCYNEIGNQWNFNITLTPTQYISKRSNKTMVTYTSADGITYTRTQIDNTTNNDIYSFDLQDGWYTYWDDAILSNFILEEYAAFTDVGIWTDIDMIQFLNLPIVNGSEITFTAYKKYPDLDELGEYILDNELITDATTNYRYVYVIDKGDNTFEVHISNAGNYLTITDAGIPYIRGARHNNKYTINLTTKTHTIGTSSATMEIVEGTHWNIFGFFPNKTQNTGHYFMQEAPVVTINGTSVSNVAVSIPTLGWNITHIPDEVIEINNQDKTITKNGTYTADTGYTGLGTVEVSVPQTTMDGQAKIFGSVEEMNAYTGATENEYAIVYDDGLIAGQGVHDAPCVFYLPNKVVLSSPITDTKFNQPYPYWKDEADNTLGYEITPTSFKLGVVDMNYDTYEYYVKTPYITYTSTDGSTYNKTLGDDTYVLLSSGSTVSIDDIAGEFLMVPKGVFDGTYQWSTKLDSNYQVGYKNPVVTSKVLSYDSTEAIYVKDILKCLKYAYDTNSNSTSIFTVVKKANGTWYAYESKRSTATYFEEAGVICTGSARYIGQDYGADSVYTFRRSTLDLATGTVSEVVTLSSSTYQYQHVCDTFAIDDIVLPMRYDGTTSLTVEFFGTNSGSSNANTNRIAVSPRYAEIATYRPVKTQFTLTGANELLPNIVALGKNGPVTGDSSIYNNLDNTELFKLLWGDKCVIYNNTKAYHAEYETNQICLPKRGDTGYSFPIKVHDDITDSCFVCAIVPKYRTGTRITDDYFYTLNATDKIISILDKNGETIRTYEIPELLSSTSSTQIINYWNGYLHVTIKPTGFPSAISYKLGLETESKTSISFDYTGTYEPSSTTYKKLNFTNMYQGKLYFCYGMLSASTTYKYGGGYIDYNSMTVVKLYETSYDMNSSSYPHSQNVYCTVTNKGNYCLMNIRYIYGTGNVSYFREYNNTDTLVKNSNATGYQSGCYTNGNGYEMARYSYEDDTYVYWDMTSSSKYRLNKNTCISKKIEAWPDAPRYYTFDGLYGTTHYEDTQISPNGVTERVYRIRIYDMAKGTAMNVFSPSTLISPDSSDKLSNQGITPIFLGYNEDGNIKLRFRGRADVDAKRFEYTDTSDYDYMLVADIVNPKVAPQYLYTRNSTGESGPISQVEYDTCNNLAAIALGETPLIDDPNVSVTLDVSNNDTVKVENNTLIIEEVTE